MPCKDCSELRYGSVVVWMATVEEDANALAGMPNILNYNSFRRACGDALLADKLCSDCVHGVGHGVLVFPSIVSGDDRWKVFAALLHQHLL